MTEEQIKHMVNRFLGWKLPTAFNPDAGISFKATFNETSPWGPMKHEPVGTNLFSADQAREMVRHMVDELPDERASELATLRRRVAEIDQKLVAWFEAQLQLEQGAFSGAMTHDMRALQRAANEAKHTVFDLAREAASPLPPGRNEG